MNNTLWQRYQHAADHADLHSHTRDLAALAEELRELTSDEDRRLLVNVLASLTLLADDQEQTTRLLAEAEDTATRIGQSPARELAHFVVTEVALRVGHPDVTVRCAGEVTAAGLATAGLQSLYWEAADYSAQARARLEDPGLSDALASLHEAIRVDPGLSVSPAQKAP